MKPEAARGNVVGKKKHGEGKGQKEMKVQRLTWNNIATLAADRRI